jgi:predicted hydrocarbon binding protein
MTSIQRTEETAKLSLQPHTYERLRVNEDAGCILDGENRLLLFDVKTLQAFSNKLLLITGSTVGKQLLYQIGRAIGEEGYRNSKERMRTEEDWQKVFDEVLKFLGWGRCLDMKIMNQTGYTQYVFRATGTLESHKRESSEPTCHLQRGTIAGWLEAHLDNKAVSSTEIQCAAQGAKQCVFEIKFETPTSSHGRSEEAPAK